MPRDINVDAGLVGMTPENTIIKYMSDKELPEEFKGFPIDIDESLDIPETIKEKTHTQRKANFRLG